MAQAHHAENGVQLTAYAKVDAKSHRGIPVLVRVKAPTATLERKPVDLVAVLDVNCCGGLGPVNRMDLLRKAMDLVIGKLSKDDCLAIVPVQASAITENLKLREMDAEGRSEATKRVKSLVATGDNKLSRALKKAEEILDKREEDKRKAGFIILISDGDDGSVLRGEMNLNYSVHAFGFRDAHNPRAMHHIANISTGTYGILNDEDDGITEAFTSSVNNITSIVAVNAVVTILCKTESTAKLSAIESGRFKWEIKDDRTSGSITAGALQAGAVRRFIVYVDGDVDENNELPITVHVRCEGRSTSQHAQNIVQQSAQVVVVRHGDENSRLVAAEIVRVEAMRIVDEIIKKYNDNGKALSGAADELHDQWRRLKESEYGEEAGQACLISGLTAEMEDMEATIRRSCGMSYMLSWQTCHSLQHLKTTRPSSSSVTTMGKGSSAVAGATASPNFMARGAEIGKFVGMVAGERKRKHYYSSELEMIEHRLTYWSKVKCELPPMHHDGECPDHMTTLFRDASHESIDRAMYHDVFLAVVHATGRRSSKSGGHCSCRH